MASKTINSVLKEGRCCICYKNEHILPGWLFGLNCGLDGMCVGTGIQALCSFVQVRITSEKTRRHEGFVDECPHCLAAVANTTK